MTPAETLTAAAKKLRERATIAGPGPWHVTICGPSDEDAYVVSPLRPIAIAEEPARAGGRRDATYIALMHPGVGLALADWLESAAEDAEQIGPDFRALAVARAILDEVTE